MIPCQQQERRKSLDVLSVTGIYICADENNINIQDSNCGNEN